MTKLTAHRGAAYRYPENTLAAFHQAVKDGADRIEFDVHETLDKAIVVHHDYVLEGACSPLHRLKLSQVRALNPDIPTLSEVLEIVPEWIEVEVELKGFSEEFLKMAVGIVENQRGLLTAEFTSPHHAVINAARRYRPNAILGVFVSPFPAWMERSLGEDILLSTLQMQGVDVAHLPVGMINVGLVRKAVEGGIALHAANCNKEADITEAIRFGVRQLSTDYLPLAIEVRNGLSAESASVERE